ncbi:50S ribosomal protein L21 [Candidatus Uhrbacteria bacterium]|nr:50S ribosomal protein L21 [Candidatus Uhrbacteria bacterium]
MKSAVIETGGKQYRVSPNQSISIEKLPQNKAGDTVVFDKVLLLDDGKEVKIGTPYVDGATVKAVIEKEGRAKKITIMTYKAKTRQHRKKGHRQPFMKIKISA